MRTSIDFSASSVNVPIFEADNRFARTTSFSADSNTWVHKLSWCEDRTDVYAYFEVGHLDIR